ERLQHLALQLPGVVAERRDLTDPAQREGRLGLRASEPGLDRLPYLSAPRHLRVDRGRDLAHHLRVGLLQQRDEAGLLAGEVLVKRPPRGAGMAYHVGDRRLAEPTLVNGRGHAIKKPPPELAGLLHVLPGFGLLPRRLRARGIVPGGGLG